MTEHSYGPYGRYTGATLSDGTEVKLDIAKTLGLPDLGGETGVFVPADQRETSLTDGRGKDPTGFSAIESTGAFSQAAGTSGQISNVGIGLACLFNTIAASIQYEENFVKTTDVPLAL